MDDLTAFWGSIWDFFEVRSSAPYTAVVEHEAMPGARWFPGARLNFAEHLLGADDDLDANALIALGQTRDRIDMTFRELREQVARARAGLQRLGVGRATRGRVHAEHPRDARPFAATASLGASGRAARRSSARAACRPPRAARADGAAGRGGYGYRTG